MNVSTRAKLAWMAAAALILAGGVAIWMFEAQRSVVFVNGFDEPLTVRMGSTTVTVAPHARATARVRAGGVDVEVHGQDGRLLDRHALRIPSDGGGTPIYNPLGAAPLYQENIVYRPAASSTGGPPPNYRPLAGERFLVVHANYVLEDPPKSISVKQSSGYTVHQHVGMLDGGWKAAIGAIEDVPQGYERAYALARRIAAALPGDQAAGWWALRATMILEGPEAAGAAAVAVLAQGEKGRWAEYAFLNAMRRAGRSAELRPRYRTRLEKENSAAAAVDLSRVLPAAEAEGVLRQGLAAHPETELVRMLARLLVKTGRTQEALQLYARIPEKEREGDDLVQLAALIRARQTTEALKLALDAASRPDASAPTVARYVRLARVAGAKAPRKPEEIVAAWAKGRDGATEWLASLVGEDPPAKHAEFPPAQLATLSIQRVATRDPEKALARCRDAGVEGLVQLEGEMAVLLAAEAWRAGDAPLFDRLYAVTSLPLSAQAVRGWIDRGEEPQDGWRLDPGERAGILLARARRLAAAGQASPTDLAAALTEDPLLGSATLAAARWPAPARSAGPVRLVLAPAANP